MTCRRCSAAERTGSASAQSRAGRRYGSEWRSSSASSQASREQWRRSRTASPACRCALTLRSVFGASLSFSRAENKTLCKYSLRCLHTSTYFFSYPVPISTAEIEKDCFGVPCAPNSDHMELRVRIGVLIMIRTFQYCWILWLLRGSAS